jgi:hypothetical protein
MPQRTIAIYKLYVSGNYMGHMYSQAAADRWVRGKIIAGVPLTDIKTVPARVSVEPGGALSKNRP